MAGRALRGMLSTADYKGGKALKSCHTEFVHIYSALMACEVLERLFDRLKVDIVTRKGLSPFISQQVLKEVEYV